MEEGLQKTHLAVWWECRWRDRVAGSSPWDIEKDYENDTRLCAKHHGLTAEGGGFLVMRPEW